MIPYYYFKGKLHFCQSLEMQVLQKNGDNQFDPFKF